MMQRVIASATVVALCASLALASVAMAAKPSNGCPSTASAENRARMYFSVDNDGWWMQTVDDFVAAGIPVYVGGGYSGEYTDEFNAFGADFGLVDGAGVENFVRLDQWAAMDKNGNGLVCMKKRPLTPGNPEYIVNGVDDQSSSKNG